MLNKVMMMGRITRDLELKTTPNGKTCCVFSIAVERNFKSADGERETDFFNVSTWGKTAETVAKYFSKGRLILVEGEMQTRKYTDRNGLPATWYEISANQVYFTGEKTGDAQSAGNPNPAPAPANDDYPF